MESANDARLLLQDDIFAVSNWLKPNGLSLNIKKCSVKSFSRSNNPNYFIYSINGTDLDRVNKVKDLGLIFYSKLSFSSHVDCIVSNTFKTLEFV